MDAGWIPKLESWRCSEKEIGLAASIVAVVSVVGAVKTRRQGVLGRMWLEGGERGRGLWLHLFGLGGWASAGTAGWLCGQPPTSTTWTATTIMVPGWVSTLASIGMAVGPPLVYSDQATSIVKKKDSTGFSRDVCAILCELLLRVFATTH
jgi:hypothetical protein